MRVKVLAILLFYCSCGMKLFSETLPIIAVNLNPNGNDVPKMKQIHKTWSRIGNDEKSYDVAEIGSSKPFELTYQTDFVCCICYESRFVSLKPNCDHAICAICVCKIFETRDLNNKCAVCREELPNSLDDYSANYHKISDLKPEESGKAAIIAAAKDKIKILKSLAEARADLNQAKNNGVTPVWIAAQEGNTDIVKFLAEKKADLNRAVNNGATPIFVAAQEGHTAIVKFLAEEKVDLNQAKNNGVTPVWIAAYRGHTEIVKFLIESNVNVEESFLSLAETEEIREFIVEALRKNKKTAAQTLLNRKIFAALLIGFMFFALLSIFLQYPIM